MTTARKLFAFDMDGTFLRSDRTYDRDRLVRTLDRFDEHGFVFAVASGRQLLILESLFAPVRDRIAFVAENGAVVVHQGRTIAETAFSMEQLRELTDLLYSHPAMAAHRVMYSGQRGSYALASGSREFLEVFSLYEENCRQVGGLDDLDDTIYKLCVNISADWDGLLGPAGGNGPATDGVDQVGQARQAVPVDIQTEQLGPAEQVGQLGLAGQVGRRPDRSSQAALSADFERWMAQRAPYIHLASIGLNSFDIIRQGVSKAVGLQHLVSRLGLTAADVVAFGDQLNDLEMLDYAGTAIAMSNADPALKPHADLIIGTNDEDAVFAQLDLMLEADAGQ